MLFFQFIQFFLIQDTFIPKTLEFFIQFHGIKISEHIHQFIHFFLTLCRSKSSLSRSGGGEHLIRWYAMTPDGGEVDKMYTYHNYPEGWYMELTVESGSLVSVQPLGGGTYSFGLWDRKTGNITPMWLVDVLTGDDRSALAAEEGRFVLMKTDTVVYAARLEMGGRELGVTQEMLTGAFRLIRSSWYTGEM